MLSSVSEHDLTNLFCIASFQEVPECRTLCDKTIIFFNHRDVLKAFNIGISWVAEVVIQSKRLLIKMISNVFYFKQGAFSLYSS